MGWYGGDTNCPNCGSEKAIEMYRNDMLNRYFLVCVDCGLHLLAAERRWVVSNSYIDKSVIGKNPDQFNIDDMVDEGRNEDILPEGSAL
jgi:transcription elongation factor Elf1